MSCSGSTHQIESLIETLVERVTEADNDGLVAVDAGEHDAEQGRVEWRASRADTFGGGEAACKQQEGQRPGGADGT